MRGAVRIAVLLLAAIVFAVFALPARADFASAARAFDGGDYAGALGEWRRLAEAGDVAAQVAIAGMYRDGAGLPADPVRAARWYRRAAEAGDAVAQMNLGEMYMLGAGVERDRISAYVWLSRAAAKGRDWAAERRDRLASGMTAGEIATAQRRLDASR